MFSRSTLWVLLAVAIPDIAVAAEDVVVFDNGDRLTGEIKLLERGKLSFKTDATDTIAIEWDKVAFLSSEQNIQIEMNDGRRYFGHLIVGPKPKTINVQLDDDIQAIAIADVVLLTPIEDRGLNRLDGDITAGYNFAKASSVEQLQFGLDMKFRTENREISLKTDSATSDSDTSEASQRHSVSIDTKRFWPNRWLVSAFVSADRNDELGIDLRTSAGGGGGRVMRQSNRSRILVESGLMLSRENLAESESDEETVEAYVNLNWDWYRFNTPELDLSTSLEVIPNLTDTGRIRGEFDIALKWEIINDLFWQVSIYDSYDSDPVTAGAEKNDYGVTTSLGYDF